MRMSEFDPGLPRPLPDDLERALRQAAGRTFESLGVLRRALRQHVQSERDHGVGFVELEVELRKLVTCAEGESTPPVAPEGLRTNLSNQVVKWSEGYFSENR
jgi:hypothetical protein